MRYFIIDITKNNYKELLNQKEKTFFKKEYKHKINRKGNPNSQ